MEICKEEQKIIEKVEEQLLSLRKYTKETILKEFNDAILLNSKYDIKRLSSTFLLNIELVKDVINDVIENEYISKPLHDTLIEEVEQCDRLITIINEIINEETYRMLYLSWKLYNLQ